MCDRLYFDELTFERVMDILELENPHGVIVSTGGQIPNNLALRLDAQNINILGTSAKSIDNAEDREKFSAMLDRIGVDQPRWRELTSMDDIQEFVEEVGFPVLVRPSYVLSGAAMNVCSNQEELERFLKLAANVSKKHPVVVSQFIEHAKEVEMDAVAQNGEIVAYAISEHIEFAGVHSGDATIQFPPQKLYVETVRRIKRISREIAKALNADGIETTIYHIGAVPVGGCVGCGGCAKAGHCVFGGPVVDVLPLVEKADGIVFGAPVHYSTAAASMLGFMHRLGYSAGRLLAQKPAAIVTSARRAGTTATLDVLNKYFIIRGMPIVPSQYWCMVHGNSPDEVAQDKEGLQIMRTLGRNMAWLLRCIEAGKAAGISHPENPRRPMTNFIR